MKKTLIIIIAVLTVVAGITAYLNGMDKSENRQQIENGIFVVKYHGEEVKRYDLAAIQAEGEVEFQAVKDTSLTGPEAKMYTGVPLRALFEKAGVEVLEADTVINRAADGYTTAITGKQVLMEDNVYLVYAEDGAPLQTSDSGGDGPYMIVISQDQFSQNWCKYALSSDVE